MKFTLLLCGASTILAITPLNIVNPHRAQELKALQNIRTAVDKNDGPEKTVWGLIESDSDVSIFAKILGEFDDIVGGLNTPQARFTAYVPTNKALTEVQFDYDLPWFFWKLLVGYHMGPGAYSAETLMTTNTIPTFLNADIFAKYPQRISTQVGSEKFSFNHNVTYVKSDIVSVYPSNDK